jgi:2-haloacid dehalogenase
MPAARPRFVAFDIIETTFSLDSLRPLLTALGLPPSALELWFARTLRDAFALAATGVYAGFTDIANDTLLTLAAEHAIKAEGPALKSVLDGFAELDPQPDAGAAFQTLQAAGIGIMALSNGAAETTKKLLDRSGLAPLVRWVVSVADIRIWKPRPEIYLYTAKVAGVAPGEMALVATHA